MSKPEKFTIVWNEFRKEVAKLPKDLQIDDFKKEFISKELWIRISKQHFQKDLLKISSSASGVEAIVALSALSYTL